MKSSNIFNNSYFRKVVLGAASCCILAGCSFTDTFGTIGSSGMAIGKFYLTYGRMPSSTDDYIALADILCDSLDFGNAFGTALGSDLDRIVEEHKQEGKELEKTISVLNSRVEAYEDGNKELREQIKECQSAVSKGASSAKLRNGISKAKSEAKSKRSLIDRDIAKLKKNRAQYASQIADLEKQRAILDANIRDLNDITQTLR